jgi:uridine kinase
MPTSVATAARHVIGEVQLRQRGIDRPVLLAIDGGSGAGKSTLALLIAAELDAAYIASDDFFAANITDEGWAQRSPEERAADAIDWRRLRRDVLGPLLRREKAQWYAFDFALGPRPDGTYSMLPAQTELAPTDFIVLDGAYSGRPELADIVDFCVLVDVPVHKRHERLSLREDKKVLDAWHSRWDGAEQHYFTNICPPSRFDLTVLNSDTS